MSSKRPGKLKLTNGQPPRCPPAGKPCSHCDGLVTVVRPR